MPRPRVLSPSISPTSKKDNALPLAPSCTNNPRPRTQLHMPAGGPDVRTRVTRRSEADKPQESRIATSEYMEQARGGLWEVSGAVSWSCF